MGCGNCAPKQESLAYRAAECAKEIPLGSGLNSLGYDLDLESSTQADQRIDDRAIIRIDLQVADERPIDFDNFNWETLEVGQGCEACAEIVERQLDPHFSKFMEAALNVLHPPSEQHALSHFDLDAMLVG